MTRRTVLVACRQNAGRSQAAAALLRHYAGDQVDRAVRRVRAGATRCTRRCEQVLAERGLEPERRPKRFDAEMVRPPTSW